MRRQPALQPAGDSFCFGRRGRDGMIGVGLTPPGEEMDEPAAAAARS
jgi:hypothetical protein